MEKTIVKGVGNIPYKSKIPEGIGIRQRNELFMTFTPGRMRREIAYEALKVVLTESVYPSDGYYWSGSLTNLCHTANTSHELQKLMVKNLPSCSVCERGLMMIAQIRLSNNIRPDHPDRARGCSSIIKGFSEDSFYAMESEYERDFYNLPHRPHTLYKLMNIACNVVKNGDFDRRDKTDYVTKWNLL